MSTRGQDVDESWEEIDEEQLAARLNKQTNEGSSKSAENSGSASSSSSSRPGVVNNNLSAMLEEELRPRMILQRPQMQILRRPQAKAQEDPSAAESKPKTQIKSLDQRKQEYAEARLRILGSAHDEEEQQQKQIEQAKKGSPNTNGYRINNNGNSNNNSINNNGQTRVDRPQNSYRSHPGNYHVPQAQHQPPHPGPPFYPPHHPAAGRNQLPPPPPPEAATNHHYFQQQGPPPPPHPGGYSPYSHHQLQHALQKQLGPHPYGMPPQTSTGYHQHHHHHGGGLGPIIPPYGSGGPLGHHNNSNNNVLRMPAGPDGSHGFTMRR